MPWWKLECTIQYMYIQVLRIMCQHNLNLLFMNERVHAIGILSSTKHMKWHFIAWLGFLRAFDIVSCLDMKVCWWSTNQSMNAHSKHKKSTPQLTHSPFLMRNSLNWLTVHTWWAESHTKGPQIESAVVHHINLSDIAIYFQVTWHS